MTSLIMTPHGIHVHLPCIELGQGTGCILVDIFCVSVDTQSWKPLNDRIHLFLELNSASDGSPGYPLYNCQLLGAWSSNFLKTRSTWSESRLINLTSETVKEECNSAMWKNIYISPRPRHRSHITSGPHIFAACLALTPSSPFWIKPSTLSNVSNRGLQLIFVTRPHTIPWTGDYPVKLVFQCMDFSLHVTLGTCKINIDVSHNSSTSNHYVVLKYSRDNTDTSGSSRTRADTPSHNCVKDHVTQGSTRITKLTSLYSQEMHMSFTRSQKDPDDETLEIHTKFKVR